MKIATALANSNIAIIKYWGNSNDELIIPSNNSISFTMDDKLQTKTTVILDEEFTIDELWINDQKATAKETERVASIIELVRIKAKSKLKAKIFSENSFPKGAGLASSASSFAALSGATCKAYSLGLNKKELSKIARMGSGSASRSIFGGAVEWIKGIRKDGEDCYAQEIAPKEKFKELRNIVAILERKEKKIGSREGMKITTSTSKNFENRLIEVEKRLKIAREAILDFDFEKLAPVIMEDSDSMHKVMKESNPSLIYMNDISHKIRKEIIELNKSSEKYLGAYTFDAGPNAHIYTLSKNTSKIKSILNEIEGVQEIIECGIGDGIRFSDSHLM
ncbi:MAG: diphosphomevalonate decarboxylase [Candidatus ainarchaeum sp.]|nr:diphosphomevalonate decarboxylase [Candidatus ainarchaeum sp.]